MFQFPTFAICNSHHRSNTSRYPGFPIRTSTDQCLFAAPRSFSQLTTSFVASKSLGIPHTPLFASYSLQISLVSYPTIALTRFISNAINHTAFPSTSVSVSAMLNCICINSLSACQRSFSLHWISRSFFLRDRKYKSLWIYETISVKKNCKRSRHFY
jgi:hypothetical protein